VALLDKINQPSDINLLRPELLPELAREMRGEIIRTVASSGGHLASSLGTVELALALHHVFDSPKDKILWDVGHQAYAHKLLTGRAGRFETLRRLGGISGFPSPLESEHDPVVAGHSGTAVSSALGIALGRDSLHQKYKVVAVIGDGSLSTGMTYEGLNNAGQAGTDLLVVLNDNAMFISPRVGGLSTFLARLLTRPGVRKLELRLRRFLNGKRLFGLGAVNLARRLKVIFFPGMLFEELGFGYLGPVDGHNLFELIELFKKVREINTPVVVHIITKKGKGYLPAETNPTKFHSASQFNPITGEPEVKGNARSYTSVFSDTIVTLARQNPRIVAITAAMCEGTGLERFRKEFPGRFYDAGIAEQHAVTFCAGLAHAGLKPVFAVYSTFLQRAYDQLIHDVCLPKLPVILAIDRAGIVGEDGPTHQGLFDLSFLRMIPNMVVMVPADEQSLRKMFATAAELNCPVAIRYPRGEVIGMKIEKTLKPLEFGKSRTLRQGNDGVIIGVGPLIYRAMLAAEQLAANGKEISVIDARFVKPLDTETILEEGKRTGRVLTVEENVLGGGFGSAVKEVLSETGIPVRSIGIPDVFVEHGPAEELREKYDLTVSGIAKAADSFFQKNNEKV